MTNEKCQGIYHHLYSIFLILTIIIKYVGLTQIYKSNDDDKN